MPRLTPCPSCHSHVLVGDRQCPHCGTALRTTTAARASVVLMGLALAGCPGDDTGTSTTIEPDYGVPDTSGVTDTEGVTDGSTTDTSGATAGEAEYGVAETSAGEADYGVAETTAADTSTGGTSAGSSSAGSSSVGEPDYGVPETTTG